MPILEGSHATGLIHDVVARLQVEVISVGQDGLRAGGPDLFRGQRLYRGLGGHRDEGRGLDISMRRMDNAGAAVLSRLCWTT